MARHRETRRREADIADLLASMRKNLRTWPDARPVIGVVQVMPWAGETPGTVEVAVGGSDFGPVHWVALADQALEWAAKRMAAVPGDNRENLLAIDRARAALDFEEMTKQ